MPKRARTSTLLIVALLAALLVPLGATPAGAVELPPPDTLIPNGESYSSNPSLSWNAVPGAVRYRVWYADNPSFTGVRQATTYQPGYAPPERLGVGTYYWKVRSIDDRSTLGPWSADATFSIGLAGPTPTAPANGAIFEYPTQPASFSWTDVPGAKSYKFQWDDAEDFIGATTITSQTNGAILTGPTTFDQVHYWRVQADFGGGVQSEWSAAQSFTVTWPNQPGKGRPVLLEPADTQPLTQVTDIELEWAPVLGATTYQLQVSLNSDFSNQLLLTNVTNTRYTPPTTWDNGSYWWRIRAREVGGQLGPWSDPSAFSRAWPAAPPEAYPGVPNPVALTFPTEGAAVAEPMKFVWQATDRASTYEVQIGRDPNWSSGTYGTCHTVRTTLSYNGANSSVGGSAGGCGGFTGDGAPISDVSGVTFWRVRGKDAPSGVIGLWSETRSFTYVPYPGTTPTELTPPTQTGPANCEAGEACAAHATTPEMTWTSVPGATHYVVWVAIDKNFTNQVGKYTVQASSAPALQPRDEWPDNNAGQAYYWHVQPCAGGSCLLGPEGQGDPPRQAFQKRSSAPIQIGPGIPFDAENPPSQGSIPVVTEMPRFSWEPYLTTTASGLDARHYRVHVATDAQFINVIDNKTMDQPFYTSIGATYPEGPLYWRLTAYDGSNNSLTVSETFVFRFSSVPPALASPAANASLTSVPQFDWELIPNVRGYYFELYENGDDPLSTGNRIDNRFTQFESFTPYDSLAPGTYAWRVQGRDAQNRQRQWSEVRRFTIQGIAPDLLGPAEGEVFADDRIEFTWEMDANPANYLLQTSTSPDFSTTLENRLTVQTTWLPDRHYSGGTYYWRVLARDGNGATIGTSDVRSFVKQDPDAIVSNVTVSPSSGALTVRWRLPADASSYTAIRLNLQPGNIQISLPKAATSRIVNGLVNGQSYDVFVYAMNGATPSVPVTGSGQPNGCTGTPFKDVVKSHPFCDEIAWMYTSGISQGTGQGDGSVLYKPTDPVSRQAMAAFLHRFDGNGPVTPAAPHFADVTGGSFFADIQWMAETELSLGTPDPPRKPLYKPTNPVSRQAMSAFLHRYDGDEPSDETSPVFQDVGETHTFYDDIQWMGGTGLSEGTPDKPRKPLYKPVDPVSRMAMAAFLYRYDMIADD